jgi:ribosomal protein S18 acetylase RimI-like enzyme
MAEDVIIRQLGPADWPALKAVRLAALADAPEAFASTLAREQEYSDQRWREWLDSTAATFGAFTAAGPDSAPAARIGGVAAAFVRPRPAGEDGDTDWHLISMWVSPGLRGTGVAGGLVDAVRAQARRAGADQVSLWVTDVNDRARAFYERLGFAPTGRRQLVRADEPGHWETELAQRLG